jgi:hypothetical protein
MMKIDSKEKVYDREEVFQLIYHRHQMLMINAKDVQVLDEYVNDSS